MCIDYIIACAECHAPELIAATKFKTTKINFGGLFGVSTKINTHENYPLYGSPCPNLEGINDALSYKFRRLMIGQNCCAVCTNKVARALGAIEMHSQARASGASAACFDRPARQAGHRASSEARGDVCSLPWSGGRFDVRAE